MISLTGKIVMEGTGNPFAGREGFGNQFNGPGEGRVTRSILSKKPAITAGFLIN